MKIELATDPKIVVWWSTEVECVSALFRLRRMGELDLSDTTDSLNRLDELKTHWHEVAPVETVRTTARRLLAIHPLRAGDAQQLAAALVAAEGDPASMTMVTLDDRLADAARLEGLVVVSA